MGYDLHVTRAEDWFDSENFPIHMDEWLSLVESDPEMRLDGYTEVVVPGEGVILRNEKDGIAVWTAWSKNGVDGNCAWFFYSDGEISVKNPDAEIRVKMFKIAKMLNAMVKGDDGENYDEQGESDWVPTKPKVKKPWWRLGK